MLLQFTEFIVDFRHLLSDKMYTVYVKKPVHAQVVTLAVH